MSTYWLHQNYLHRKWSVTQQVWSLDISKRSYYKTRTTTHKIGVAGQQTMKRTSYSVYIPISWMNTYNLILLNELQLIMDWRHKIITSSRIWRVRGNQQHYLSK
jgi:hypothetical protein